MESRGQGGVQVAQPAAAPAPATAQAPASASAPATANAQGPASVLALIPAQGNAKAPAPFATRRSANDSAPIAAHASAAAHASTTVHASTAARGPVPAATARSPAPSAAARSPAPPAAARSPAPSTTARSPAPSAAARSPAPAASARSPAPAASARSPAPGATARGPSATTSSPVPPVVTPIDKLRIIVTGYPPYSQPQDLKRTFSRYGAVNVEKISSKFAILAFTDSEEAAAAVRASGKANVYGEFLTIKPYSDSRIAELKAKYPKKDNAKNKPKEIIVEPTTLNLRGPFMEQLERLMVAVRLTREDVAKLGTLYADLEATLRLQWPGCTAIPFGSITTGLGVKWSDADCFVAIQQRPRLRNYNYVGRAKKLLEQYPQMFSEVVSIPRANTPIVKFFHIPTATHCDLSFKTPLGAQNSKLVAFLLHADPRLVPAAVLVKYWAKVHDLTGTGRLTNYALIMMLLFYLQQPPLSILPSVKWLQRDPKEDLIFDHWNTGFSREAIPPYTNTSSISELLGGFFQYYSMFDFEEMVVCPYLGYPVKKETFSDLSLLPPEFQRYKKNVITDAVYPMRINTSMCVQDPLEQCHNVAATVTTKLTTELKAYFKFAADAYDKEKLNNCEKFLEIILLEKPKIIRSKNHPEYRVNVFPRIVVTIIEPDWKPVLRSIVFTIFEDMLKIKLGKVEEKMNPDSKKEKEKYTGFVTKAIWKRRQFSRLYAFMELELRERQARISEEVLKVEKQAFSVQFTLTITYCHAPRSAVLSVKLGSGDLVAFREFGKFFVSVMQSWLTILLKPYARPPDKDTAAKIAETLQDLDLADDDSDDDAFETLLGTNSAQAD